MRHYKTFFITKFNNFYIFYVFIFFIFLYFLYFLCFYIFYIFYVLYFLCFYVLYTLTILQYLNMSFFGAVKSFLIVLFIILMIVSISVLGKREEDSKKYEKNIAMTFFILGMLFMLYIGVTMERVKSSKYDI
jgi:hypothetical protein